MGVHIRREGMIFEVQESLRRRNAKFMKIIEYMFANA